MKKVYIKPEASKEELREMLIETNERLYEANEELKRQELERARFFENLSHDLRASLSVISGALEVLRTDESGRAEIIEAALKRTGYMKRLVDDMFLLAKLDSHEMRTEKQLINLREFLTDYFYSAQADIRFEKRELVLYISDDFSEKVFIDPQLFTRVLDNLFSNAEKYSQDGARIILSASAAEPGGAVVSVKDTGCGISEDDLPYIFDRTFRSSRARTPDSGSSGLGLSIVKSIMELHGGSVSCSSEPGKGSEFRLLIGS